MKTEIQAGLELIKNHCTRGEVIVSANVGGSSVWVTLYVPKKEQEGLFEKMRTVEPFKGKEQLFSLHVEDLPFWKCRVRKYSSRIIS